ncbi:aconitate hydratase AcnA [bacterium]|nr:aconitate hydratase AcnA [bacterium]
MDRFTNSFEFNEHTYHYCDLKKVFERYSVLRKLPNSLKILLEANIRNVPQEDIATLIAAFVHKNFMKQIEFYPSRLIMQDDIGIPSMVELASLRDVVYFYGANVKAVNPQIMVDLVIDNNTNVRNHKEIQRNKERYTFIKWAQSEFKNFSLIPPNSGFSHQINLEYLSTMINLKQENNKLFIYPETIIGTNTQSTMINALGVLGLSISEIQAQASMLGSSVILNLPIVIGVEIVGSLSQGVGIIDASLKLAGKLKEHNLEDKIIEFYGSALRNMTIEDRATLSNTATQYGAICGYFGVDDNTIAYVEQTRGVDASLIKEYFIKQGMYNNHDLNYDENIKFDLSAVKPIIAGPRSLEDKIYVNKVPSKLASFKKGNFVRDNDIVLAAITAHTINSNLTLLIQAGLLAKKACILGLNINKNIKRVFNPGSLVVKEYLQRVDLLRYLEELGFYITGFEDETSIHNPMELVEIVSMDIEKFNLDVSSISSGNKNHNEKMHSLVKSNWLMSPALVVAYCLKGNMNFDITSDAISQDIYLSDIWPSSHEVNEYLSRIDYSVYKNVYSDLFLGNKQWQEITYDKTQTYSWSYLNTYIEESKLFENINLEKIDIKNARILALLGNDISTNQISPYGQIFPYTPAALYLESKGLHPDEFDTFENRLGNAEVMSRGTLSNIKLKNKMVSPKEGGFTKDSLSGEIMPIYDYSRKMKEQNIPLVIFAGKNYGIGEQRAWAAKGLKLLGVKAVIAKSFDKKYHTDLVSMGILPLEFIDDDIDSLYLSGEELICIKSNDIKVNAKIDIEIKKSYDIKTITVKSRLDSKAEVLYYKNGGILAYLLKNI